LSKSALLLFATAEVTDHKGAVTAEPLTATNPEPPTSAAVHAKPEHRLTARKKGFIIPLLRCLNVNSPREALTGSKTFKSPNPLPATAI
jgi:hypothetical protein